MADTLLSSWSRTIEYIWGPLAQREQSLINGQNKLGPGLNVRPVRLGFGFMAHHLSFICTAIKTAKSVFKGHVTICDQVKGKCLDIYKVRAC